MDQVLGGCCPPSRQRAGVSSCNVSRRVCLRASKLDVGTQHHKGRNARRGRASSFGMVAVSVLWFLISVVRECEASRNRRFMRSVLSRWHFSHHGLAIGTIVVL